MPELVTIGETCAVLVAKSAGPLRYSVEFERRLGGAESTVAVGVARLGCTAGWISRVGDDEFGQYVTGVMRSENVDVEHVSVVEDGQTGVFFRENRSGGNSAVFYYRSNSAFTTLSPAELDEDYIASARILHLTGITPGLSASCRATVERAIDIAKSAGVTTVFDLNYRAKIWSPEEAKTCFENILTKTDCLLAGKEDVFKLTGLATQAEQLEYLLDLKLSSVVLKCGADGTSFANAGSVDHVASLPVDQVCDRFGVGDAFAAGYIVGTLRDMSQRQSVELGNKVAGWSIRLPGNIESLPSSAEIASLKNALDVTQR